MSERAEERGEVAAKGTVNASTRAVSSTVVELLKWWPAPAYGFGFTWGF